LGIQEKELGRPPTLVEIQIEAKRVKNQKQKVTRMDEDEVKAML
jgi:hypothetical protein